MVLKQIITRNLQSHKEIVIDLPEKGLVVFTGDNSNGKSVIGKTLEALLTNKIAKPRKRNSLVNRAATFGSITCVRSDDAILEAHIQREAAGTYVKLTLPGQEPIQRYIADKSYRELLYRFGWHYSDEAGISLNIAQEEDALLFYKTPPRQIRSLLESATSDSEADRAVENLEAFLSETRKLKDNYTQQQNAYIQTLATIQIEDTAPLVEKIAIMERCQRILSTVYFPDIPEIRPVPKVHYVTLHKPNIPEIKYPRIVNVSCSIPDISQLVADIKMLQDHKCPTCGRGFGECSHESSS